MYVTARSEATCGELKAEESLALAGRPIRQPDACNSAMRPTSSSSACHPRHLTSSLHRPYAVPRAMAASLRPACERARDQLVNIEEDTSVRILPRGSTKYFPRRQIIKILEDFPLEDIFACACSTCTRLSGTASHERAQSRDKRLLIMPEYAQLYALLIYHNYAGLMPFFLETRSPLNSLPLEKADIERRLRTHTPLDDSQRNTIARDLERSRHQFDIQPVAASNSIIRLDLRMHDYILPIQEVGTALGRGNFATVYAIKILDEYVDDSLRLPDRVEVPGKPCSCRSLIRLIGQEFRVESLQPGPKSMRSSRMVPASPCKPH